MNKRGRGDNLDSMKKELWKENLDKKSTNTQKIISRQAPNRVLYHTIERFQLAMDGPNWVLYLWS
jgi:hypothetical protein